MKKIFSAITLLALAFSLSNCNWCTKGSGPLKTETREADNITKIEVSLDAQVTVRKGKQASINITAQENLLEKIETNIHGGKLEIESSHCISPSEPIQIEIVVTDLTLLSLSGSGNITLPDTIMTDEIKIELAGSGNIDCKLIASKITNEIAGSGNILLAGSANEVSIEIAGSGEVKANDLPCNSLDADISGSGNAYVYVIQSLKAQVNGSGEIHYKGKPSVRSEVNGSGKVSDDN